MSDGKDNPKGVVQVKRREWDTEEFRQKADERRRQTEIDEFNKNRAAEPVQRDNLQRRTFEYDLEKSLGKKQIIGKATSLSKQGFYCETCDCVIKDSLNFLDHVNGKKHQRALGMSMKVERKTADDVRNKFSALKRKKEAVKQAVDYDLDKRVEELQQQESDKRKEKYARKKRRKQQQQNTSREERREDETTTALPEPVVESDKKASAGSDNAKEDEAGEGVDPMWAAMGMPMSFGSSKK